MSGAEGRVADDVAAVLRVVVERAIDVVEAAGDEGGAGEPVIVEGRALLGWERQRRVEQRAAEHGGGAGDGVGEEQRVEVREVVAARDPVGRRHHAAVGGDDAHVAVDELRARVGVEALDAGGELVGVPDVVLIGERDVGRRRRDERERGLEVAVEAAVVLGAEDAEALVAARQLLDRGPALEARAVVVDEAGEVAARLRADRVELAARAAPGRGCRWRGRSRSACRWSRGGARGRRSAIG